MLIEINDEMTNQLFDRQAKVRDNLRFPAFASARFVASHRFDLVPALLPTAQAI